ncbi:hypothetical protein BFJ63_vAg8682 [Fusarium oxysporum f. sp. narcissi]|uniref:BTB domain-containing protein n=1 Tax=Fusarium oxysporum f. sp. narcissi TaxID=451672 RepID=A0A4Q2VPM4_FUSOX|nr:hypothetical protein NW764_001468 [Fusarium oxysporum]RYC88464.1 hypothetical protein BFJ63_vAg8682 [Fusarium oxysporum f. sp. narcissi]
MAMFDLLLERPNCQQLTPYVPSNGYDEESEDPINETTVALPTLAARYHVFDDLLPPAEAEGDLNPLGTIIYRSRFIAVAEESAIETPNTFKVRTPLEGEVRMRVSSRHLTMASHYFRSVIQGPWREASSTSSFFGKPLRQVTAVGWDVVALAIVLDIIYGRHGGMPSVVDLKLMTCLATIVDFYGCHEVVKIFSEAWYKNICTEFEDEYSRQTLMWLSVSWVFPNQEPFDRATQTILKHMDGRSQLSMDHLPIPGVLPKIHDKRQELIGKIVTGLHDLLDTLPNSDFLCDWHKYESPTCSSIALGILKRELQRLASSDRPLVPPFNGCSVMSMIQLVNDMPESIAATTEEYDHYHDVSACSVRARMRRSLWRCQG